MKCVGIIMCRLQVAGTSFSYHDSLSTRLLLGRHVPSDGEHIESHLVGVANGTDCRRSAGRQHVLGDGRRTRFHKRVLRGRRRNGHGNQRDACLGFRRRFVVGSCQQSAPRYAIIVLSGADSIGNGGRSLPTFTNSWARGHRE